MDKEMNVIVKIDYVERKIYLEKRKIVIGSSQYEMAKLDQEVMCLFTDEGYELVDNDILKNVIREKQIRENEEASIDLELRIKMILEKDILNLSDSDIILLAKYRTYKYNSYIFDGGKLLGMPTTYEKEYEKINDLINEKKKKTLSRYR